MKKSNLISGEAESPVSQKKPSTLSTSPHHPTKFSYIPTVETSKKRHSYESSSVQLFDSKTIESLDWPATQDGRYAKKFLEPLLKNGIQHYIDNVNAEIFALKIENLVLPVVVAKENYDNSYVCSPYTHYISYGKASMKLIENPFLVRFIGSLINGVGKLGRMGCINSVVYVNNWLFSTDLYPEGFTSEHLSAIVTFLKKIFPQHAIIFRSLNRLTTAPLQELLKNHGFHLIASRQVYITDAKNQSIFQTRILKSDLKLWRETPHEIIDENQISSDDYPQLLDLYNTLYINQHSSLNPQFNNQFIQMVFNTQFLQFKILKINGCIKGVAGYLERNGIMLCPFFGYDKNEPGHNVVYRLLSTSLLLEAQKRGLIFHQSAGASFYKTVRRAESCLEMMAVYTGHLSFKQKFTWAALKMFINSIAPPYMKKY
jgi:hypothetical protein